MITCKPLSFPLSLSFVKQPLSVLAAGFLSDSTRKATPPVKSAPKPALWRDIFSFAVDALDLHSWRKMNVTACILLAGFIAVVAEPLVYGGLASRFVALLTSVR